MLIHSKNLLMTGKKNYTLTIVTIPTSATCTLTYDGQSYSSKEATVEDGTIISYSVYHSTYGTKTGTITMDSDKRLNFTGTYSTSTVDTPWSQPTLSSNGTLGGSSFAVAASLQYNSTTYAAWHAFDGNTSTTWGSTNADGKFPITYTFYNPIRLKVSNIQNFNRTSGAVAAYTAGSVSGSNNNSSWTQLTTFTNSVTAVGQNWNISVNSSSYYNYYKITYTSGQHGLNATFMISEMRITATTGTTSYTYYWVVTTS